MNLRLVFIEQLFFPGSSDDGAEKIEDFMPAAFHLYKFYSTASAYHLFPDFLEFIRKFRTERPNVRTAIISNSDKRISNILLQLGVTPFIDAVVFSEEVSSSKPSPEIFEVAAQRSGLEGLQPDQILHIGDDLSKDLEAPRKLGWGSLLLNRGVHSAEELKSVQAEDVCKDFLEVGKVLDLRYKWSSYFSICAQLI